MGKRRITIKCPSCEREFVRYLHSIKKSYAKYGGWKCKECTLVSRNTARAKPLYSVRFDKSKGRWLIKTGSGWIFLHVHIMQRFLGRTMERGEVVHHCDGNCVNNKISNLELMLNCWHTVYHHTGTKRTKAHRLLISKSKLGFPNPNRSLSFEIAEKIRADYKTGGISYNGLAKKYNTSKEIIAHIIKRRSYTLEDK